VLICVYLCAKIRRKEAKQLNDGISREEHLEFAKRQDEENHRQNHRIEELEETVRQLGALTTSVEKLASSMESMVKEQEKQGKRLEVLENRDGEKWRTVVSHIITTVAGAVVCYLLMQLGM